MESLQDGSDVVLPGDRVTDSYTEGGVATHDFEQEKNRIYPLSYCQHTNYSYV